MTSNLNSLLDVALHWSRMGFAVLPLSERSPNGTCGCFLGEHCSLSPFHPRINPSELKGPPSEDDLAGWWAEWPNAVVGILTGAASGVIALELDGHVPGDLLAEFGELPQGLSATVSSKILHLFRARVPSPQNFVSLPLPGQNSMARDPMLSHLI